MMIGSENKSGGAHAEHQLDQSQRMWIYTFMYYLITLIIISSPSRLSLNQTQRNPSQNARRTDHPDTKLASSTSHRDPQFDEPRILCRAQSRCRLLTWTTGYACAGEVVNALSCALLSTEFRTKKTYARSTLIHEPRPLPASQRPRATICPFCC